MFDSFIEGSNMRAVLVVLYGIAAYLLFLAAFLYAVGFVGNFGVPKAIDSGAAAPIGETFVIDLLLLGLFAVQHSVMARPAFKRWWTRFVPKAVERSTYVLLASSVLLLLFWQWRPLADVVWVTGGAAAAVLTALFWCGWALVVASTFLISHFELFGLSQVFARSANRALPEPTFRTPWFYRSVRHPLYLGFLIAFWSAPTMSAGHLLFSIMTTGYVLVAIGFEERDLIDLFGDQYRQYRNRVGMLLPRWRTRKAHAPVVPR